MQFNNNFNYIESLGNQSPMGPGPGPNQPTQPTGSGMIVKRNLWSWLETTNNTYNASTGIWTDTSGWANNAYMSGAFGSITTNTGSFGGYRLDFQPNDYLWWANNYNNGPTPADQGSTTIFISWQNASWNTSSISLFNTSNPSNLQTDVSWWGGVNTLSGNSAFRYGWPNANGYSTAQPVPTGSTDAQYMQSYVAENFGLTCTMWMSGNLYGVNGTKLGIKNPQTAVSPTYVIDNTSTANSFNFISHQLRFGKQAVMNASYNNGYGTNTTYSFKGNVKRILIYNTILTPNEILRNYTYLNSF